MEVPSREGRAKDRGRPPGDARPENRIDQRMPPEPITGSLLPSKASAMGTTGRKVRSLPPKYGRQRLGQGGRGERHRVTSPKPVGTSGRAASHGGDHRSKGTPRRVFLFLTDKARRSGKSMIATRWHETLWLVRACTRRELLGPRAMPNLHTMTTSGGTGFIKNAAAHGAGQAGPTRRVNLEGIGYSAGWDELSRKHRPVTGHPLPPHKPGFEQCAVVGKAK